MRAEEKNMVERIMDTETMGYAAALFCKCSPEGWMEAGTYQSSAWASKYRNNDEIFKYIGSGVDGCQ